MGFCNSSRQKEKRQCPSLRRLSTTAVTRKDAFPLPRIPDCLDAVSGAALFSTLDLTSSYHQIPIRKDDIPEKAVVTKFGLYEFVSMSFGLCNEPATFQRVMEHSLQGLQWQTCLIYIDDLEEVRERLAHAHLKLKSEKCQLLQTEVLFLGHVISSSGVQPNPENISKILEWPVSTNPTEVRQILGMASYCRRFIKDFSKLVKLLTELTHKKKVFKWTSESQETYVQLKEAFTGTEIMAYPNQHDDYIWDTDASNYAVGAALSQVQKGSERVVAYASRMLNRAERNYGVTDKELLALRYFLEYFRLYLLGRKFTALVWLFSLKESKGRIA